MTSDQASGRTGAGGMRGLLGAFVLYGAAAMLLLCRPGLLTGTDYLGYDSDPLVYIWVFRFLPVAIAHGHNPFILPWAWAPQGLNITQTPTTPSLALFAWPLTALAGPVIAFNVIGLLTPPLCAVSAFALAADLTDRWAAAFIAGWLFGFSTFVFGAMLGHPQVDFVAFMPLAFLVLRQRLRGAIGVNRFVLLFGVINGLQFLTSLEGFVMMTIFIAMFVLADAAVRPGGLARLCHRGADNILVALAAAYLVVGLAMSPFIYYFFRNYAQIPHVIANGSAYSTDLLNVIVPTPLTLLGGRMFAVASAHFAGNVAEQLGYVGLPLAIVSAIAAWKTWHVVAARPIIIMLLVGLLFTLGPSLTIGGHDTGLPLPWRLMERLPLLINALPSRLMGFVVLFMSAVCAIWLGRLRRGYAVGCIVVAMSAILALPASATKAGRFWWDTKLPMPELWRDGVYQQYIGRSQTVLFLPLLPISPDAMLSEILTDGYFRSINGYGNFIPASVAAWPAAAMLRAGVAGPQFAAQFNGFMKASDARVVVMPRPYQALWGQALASAGWQSHEVGGYAVYRIDDNTWAEIPDETVSEAVVQAAGAHLQALKQAAQCMLKQGAHRLDPDMAVAAGCLAPAYRSPTAGAAANWDRMGGWLGFFGQGVAVGVMTDGATARQLAAAAGPGPETILFPYPETYDPKARDTNRSGQFLAVYDLDTLLDDRAGAD